MKKLFKNIHLWFSLPAGVVISIICFTGAMLIFEKEISESLAREYYYVERVGERRITFAEAIAAVEPTLAEGQRITGITLSSDEERTWKVNLSTPKHGAVYIDQYSGKVLGSPERLPFFRTMFRMHRWLMDTRPEDGGIYWGKVIVGVSTLFLVVILLSGIILWIPKSVAMWKNRSRIAVTHGWKRFLYDLHVAGGIYVSFIVLAMALTGLTWSFQWYRNGAYALLGAGGKVATAQQSAPRSKDTSYDSANVAYETVVAKYDCYNDATVTPSSVSVKLSGFGNPRAADKYHFDTSGAITAVELYDDAPRQRKVGGWIYAIHVGSFGGYITRVLWFLAALFAASLPVTGYYLWIKRRFMNRCKKSSCDGCLSNLNKE
jgi:uncharacterized iron-regulated membrane protein